MRVYNRALGDDEELSNYMVDRPTSDEMVVLFENKVMDDEGTDVDIDKLRAMGKSVMRIVGDVNLVNQTNNKKFEVRWTSTSTLPTVRSMTSSSTSAD